MGFKGYQYRFRINVSHSLNTLSGVQAPHMHTLELTLYIRDKSAAFEPYDTFEDVIESYLKAYSEKYLNDIPPFDTLEPTIENIGDVFYRGMKPLILENGFELEKLEISETPTRVYAVSDSMTDEALENSEKNRKLAELCDRMNAEHRRGAVAPVIPTAESIAADIPSVSEKISEKKTSSPSAEEDTYLSFDEKSRRLIWLKFIFALIAVTGIGILLSFYVYNSGNYPLGLDVYGHLFKTDFLYENIKDGNLYPLYSEFWYNGMQPYRYWPPMSYYLLALLQWFAGGSVINGFVAFVGVSFTVGAIGWLLWGLKENRMLLGFFFSVIWFFMPDNMRVFFSEGNLPRMAITMLLPYMFYFIWNFVVRKEKGKIIPVILMTALITLTHVMIGAMVGVAMFIFLLFYSVANKEYKESVQAICGMLCGIALTGIYLVPALSGGIMNTDSADISNVLYTPMSVSLNPFLRLDGHVGEFYVGISVIIIAIVGLFLSNRKSFPGFITMLIIFAGTTTALAPLVSKLPLSDLLWLRRFIPIAYTVFLIGLLCWKQCRKPVMAVMCLLLLADCIPSFRLDNFRQSMPEQVAYSSEKQAAESLSLDTAKEITGQRVTLLDLSSYGPFASYYFCEGDDAVKYNFGWAWQGATTGSNIVMLNTALEEKRFGYLFDRSLEMGNDTVVISKFLLNMNPVPNVEALLVSAGERSGYKLIESGEKSYVFHRETPGSFGVISDYKGLAIGSSANAAALVFPYFEEGSSQNIEDYTFEELCSYEKIYLSDFSYNNKSSAEELVRRVTDSGTKIYIDMNRVPANPITNRREFMGVYGQDIVFTKKFPDIIYGGEIISTENFKQEYSQWNTVYIDGADKTEAYCWYNNQMLETIGTKYNDNTIFVGMNLLYHAMETNDSAVMELMENVFGVSTEELPERQVVPINVTTESNRLIIESDYDGVNTTLAFQDNFESSRNISDINNLLHVDKGVTEIRFVYPHLVKGLIVSAGGLIASVFTCIWVFRKRRKRIVREVNYQNSSAS